MLARLYITGIPRKPLPPGHLVVHNHVRPDLDPARRAEGVESMADVYHGMNGFRTWIAAPADDDRIASYARGRDPYNVVRCDCGWASPDLAEHYRVRLEGERS